MSISDTEHVKALFICTLLNYLTVLEKIADKYLSDINALEDWDSLEAIKKRTSDIRILIEEL
jgi:hypothetical protein